MSEADPWAGARICAECGARHPSKGKTARCWLCHASLTAAPAVVPARPPHKSPEGKEIPPEFDHAARAGAPDTVLAVLGISWLVTTGAILTLFQQQKEPSKFWLAAELAVLAGLATVVTVTSVIAFVLWLPRGGWGGALMSFMNVASATIAVSILLIVSVLIALVAICMN
jgi:hypothetical protein